MGVDAEIVIRPQQVLTDKDIAVLSYELVARFGASEFLYSPAVRRVADGYDEDGNETVDAEMNPRPYYGVVTGHSYYGPAYARGHWPTIDAILRFLSARLGPTCEVLYGGDSGGLEDLRPYREVRDECEEHWNTVGHMSYWMFKPAGLCPKCAGGQLCGSGQGPEGVWLTCPGCDTDYISKNGVVTERPLDDEQRRQKRWAGDPEALAQAVERMMKTEGRWALARPLADAIRAWFPEAADCLDMPSNVAEAKALPAKMKRAK